MQLESLSYTRRWVRLPQLTYSKRTGNSLCSRIDKVRESLCSWVDKKRGVDYDSQEKLVNGLHEALKLDPDGGSKVEHYCTIL